MIRIAMFSGPRHRSTAMMRAWGSRPDTLVWDEPFYGYYLKATGIDHPMRDQVLALVETDWRQVASQCTSIESEGYEISFQKHMTHHMLPEIDLEWLDGVASCFLIREPRKVLSSYRKRREAVTAADLGYERAAELFDLATTKSGRTPPVIDADDVAAAPERELRRLCAASDTAYSPAMLRWPAGPQPSDGVWGPHWYQDLWRSTGFGPPSPDVDALPDDLEAIAQICMPHYQHLSTHKISGGA